MQDKLVSKGDLVNLSVFLDLRCVKKPGPWSLFVHSSDVGDITITTIYFIQEIQEIGR